MGENRRCYTREWKYRFLAAKSDDEWCMHKMVQKVVQNGAAGPAAELPATCPCTGGLVEATKEMMPATGN